MEWTGGAVAGTSATEQEFVLEVEGRTVPGVLWRPLTGAGPWPLVLLGHGGALHKRSDYIVALAKRLARAGMASAAIDAAGHGARLPGGGTDFQKLWDERQARRDRGELPDETENMVADWKATLDALQHVEGLAGPAGYWGLSMGTLFGLPFVAAEPRIQVAVFGLMGIAPAPTGNAWLERIRTRLGADAARIDLPVLMLIQRDDELVPFENAIALFDALKTRDKRLHLNPGRHVEVPREEFDHSAAFLAQHLMAER
ncbi:MAG: alpha/beta hydrolase [Chloroflexi bacterium]|nr:alpha/beta hydrolase [Chloroflexota bacterium]